MKQAFTLSLLVMALMAMSVSAKQLYIFGAAPFGAWDLKKANLKPFNLDSDGVTNRLTFTLQAGGWYNITDGLDADGDWNGWKANHRFLMKDYFSVQGTRTYNIEQVYGDDSNSLQPGDYTIVINSETGKAQVTYSAPADDYHPEGYQLVWSDEFDSGSTPGPDWTHEVQGPRWVNNEEQYYVNGQKDGRRVTEVSDGRLKITAFKHTDGNIYSGRIYARLAQGWRFGYFVARIRLPKGKGTWPAWWMMPVANDFGNNPWPDCGEIDIMEEVGCVPGEVNSTIHCKDYNHVLGTQKQGKRTYPDAEDFFHDYAVEWTPDMMRFTVDGEEILNFRNDGTSRAHWPFNVPFYPILNLAWGGSWGGMDGTDESALPATMEVDYVRVYQKPLAFTPLDASGNGTPWVMGDEGSVGMPLYTMTGRHQWLQELAVPMQKTADCKYQLTLTVGKSLNPDQVNFKLFANPADWTGFVRTAGTFRVASFVSEDFTMGNGTDGDDGNINLKDGHRLNSGDQYILTLDCTRGVGQAVVTLQNAKDASAITQAETAGSTQASATHYDLCGRPVGSDYRGVVICNGRKCTPSHTSETLRKF